MGRGGRGSGRQRVKCNWKKWRKGGGSGEGATVGAEESVKAGSWGGGEGKPGGRAWRGQTLVEGSQRG